LSIKLAWVELNATGTFTVATLGVLTLAYFAMALWLRKS
jgi:hypothetical protein